MVVIIARIYARNTGVQHNLILGATILDYDWNTIFDMPWYAIYDMPAGMTDPIWVETGASGTMPAGTYRIIAKAWETFDLTGATLLDSGEGFDFYSGGSLYGELDSIDGTFNIVAGQVSAEITDLQITI